MSSFERSTFTSVSVPEQPAKGTRIRIRDRANAFAFIGFRIWGGGINPLPYNWHNDGPLVYVGISKGTLYYVRIYMGPFVTNNPRRLDEELIIEGPIKR